MELLDLLEQKVNELLDRQTKLTEENARLRSEVEDGLSGLATENQALKESLEEERRTKAAVLSRLDALLLRLKVHPAEEERPL